MTNKHYWISVMAAFIGMGFVAAGLVSIFQEQMASMTAIGRSEEAMMSLMWVQMLGYFVITCIMVYIYSKFSQNDGWITGARYGGLIGLLMCGVSMLNYSMYPIELQTLYVDMIINIIVYTIGGIITALLYKPKG